MRPITPGLVRTLPEGRRETYRLGPRMRAVLRVLYFSPGPHRPRRMCRGIGEALGVSWLTIWKAVVALREWGLVEGAPYRLTPAGERVAQRLFGPRPDPVTTVAVAPPARPRPALSGAHPAPSPPARRDSAAPATLSDWERRCGACGYDTMGLLPGHPRRLRCRRCGAERLL
jgi:hypothetical protein